MSGLLNQIRKGDNKRVVVLIRHGETEMNEENLSRGWSETALDAKGERHSKTLGRQLKHYSVDGICASDLMRTMQTALEVSKESGIPIIGLYSNLHTWKLGSYEGKPTDEIDPILERLAVEEPEKEIKGGESFNNFKFRFLLQVVSLLNSNPGMTLALVVHGRNLAVFNAWQEAGYPDDLEVSTDDLGYEDFKNGMAYVFEVDSNLLT